MCVIKLMCVNYHHFLQLTKTKRN